MDYTAEISIGLRRTQTESLQAALSKLSTPIAPPDTITQVVIKPSIFDPDLVGNTNVELVRAIVRMFRNLGPVSIVESDNPRRSTELAYKKMGYTEILSDQANLVNLSKEATRSIMMPGNYFTNHNIPSLLVDDVFLVNVPTVKLEPEICSVGAGIKNLFGLLPECDKRLYHSKIDDVLIDLLSTIRPHLTVVDFTSIVFGNREDGLTKEVGAVIVGTDPVAVDAYCADLMGIDPMTIPHLNKAYELGLGEILLDRIRVSGTSEQKSKFLDHFR